jgi:protein TonB
MHLVDWVRWQSIEDEKRHPRIWPHWLDPGIFFARFKDYRMATNPGMSLKCKGISVLIHAIILAVLLSSVRNTPRRGDVIEIVLMDENSLTLPIEDSTQIPAKPKRPALASQPIRPKAVVASAGRDNTVVESEDTRPNPIAAAVENGSNQQTCNEIQRESLLPTLVENTPLTMTEPLTEGFPGGSGTGTGTDGNSGRGIGGGGGSDRTGGFGSGITGQGAWDNSNLVSFGSPTGPRFLQRKIPEYPFAARRRKKEGKVVLAITIDANGSLKHVEVIEASDPLFVQPSIAALKKSSFLPAIRNGTPITVKAILPIRFALSD